MDKEEVPKPQKEADKGSIGRRPPTRNAGDSMPPPGSVCCGCRRLVLQSQQVLPYMAAYVCFDCQAKKESIPVLECEITNKVFAPWTLLQVDAISDYQKAENLMPFVCPAEHVLIPDEKGLHCNKCPAVHLLWVYSWILDQA